MTGARKTVICSVRIGERLGSTPRCLTVRSTGSTPVEKALG